MIDRIRSLYTSGGEGLNDKLSQTSRRQANLNLDLEDEFHYNRQLVERTNSHIAKMREHISRYRRNVGKEETAIIAAYKDEQSKFARDRNMLKAELDKLESKKKKDTPEYNFIKKELLRAVKNQIDLELELNGEVTKQKEEKEELKKRLLSNSPLLANAVRDIESKLQDIKYLEQQINQCLQLLEIIGILTHESGEKIDKISERVRTANYNIERAQANIDKAKIAMQKSRCRMCCIIVLSLIAIILVVVVLFGSGIIKL